MWADDITDPKLLSWVNKNNWTNIEKKLYPMVHKELSIHSIMTHSTKSYRIIF